MVKADTSRRSSLSNLLNMLQKQLSQLCVLFKARKRLLTGPPLGEGEGWSLLGVRGLSEPDKQVSYHNKMWV